MEEKDRLMTKLYENAFIRFQWKRVLPIEGFEKKANLKNTKVFLLILK